MARQEEFEGVIAEDNRVVFCQLLGVMQVIVIWPGKLSQPHKSEETHTQLGAEKQVIM